MKERNFIAANIGANSENYQVKDVADKVKKLVKDSKVVFTGEIGEDPRNYRVNFDFLSSLRPDFKLSYNLDSGMEELYKELIDKKFSLDDFISTKFVRLKTLQERMKLLK
jgi:nucleoside-diphosphate-sugar epimerase